MFNSIINSHKNLKQKKKATSSKKLRNTFLSIYDYNSPTTASGSTASGPHTTSGALKKVLAMAKNNSQIHDVNTVSINSINGKPLMIKVNNDANGLMEFNNSMQDRSNVSISLKITDYR